MSGIVTSPSAAGPLLAAPSTVDGMGAVIQPERRECTFRVWSLFADAVYVVGSFTTPPWDIRIALARDNPMPGDGHHYWSAHVGGVRDHDQYKFIIQRGSRAPIWKLDPYCRNATVSLDANGQSRPNNSIIDDPTFDWGSSPFHMPSWNELVIYEMHVGTFNNIEGRAGEFDEAVQKLDHLVELGVNAIEVMPAHDFETKTSMGYNPSLLFAIDEAYGEQQAVQKFVKAAHAKGIAVIFDVVYNHFGPGSGDCLWQFDGWSQNNRGGIYFYNDDRAICEWGENRPDFGRPEVRHFIRDNAMMWLHEYRADGLRFDSTVNIHRAMGKDNYDRGGIPEGWELMKWINNDKDAELPWNITIAEDLKHNEDITKETRHGGAGFNSQWDVSFYHALKDAVTRPADVGAIADALQRRYNGDAFRRVIYSESHDEVTIKSGVWLGRLPEKIDPGNADSWKAKKRSTLAAALTLTAPGIPMLFQGQELLEWGTWTDNPEISHANSMLDWSKKERFRGIFELYRRLVALRRNRDGNTRGLTGQHLNVFHVNRGAKVIAYHRWMNGGPGDDVIVVANFSEDSFDSYNVGLPCPGTWYLRFNSDWDMIPPQTPGNHGMKYQGNVGLGPYSAIILSQ
ncbi:hypothetical protein H2199_005709 [Coniosporium tulheliwenetii]|uniref:Uncharacterized protein n=1 Tax=Coniosporium tulheliwenetii TaxID=3383036 RepID=A0ACC2Z132_9PEZI|nr:hypothetical protein H2199_005709 [Cladosporium sp. JES 115]